MVLLSSLTHLVLTELDGKACARCEIPPARRTDIVLLARSPIAVSDECAWKDFRELDVE